MMTRSTLTFALLSLLAAPAFAGGGSVQVIVKFKGDVDATLVKKKGGKILAKLADRGAVVASVAPGKISKLRADPSVSYVEEDGICEALGNGNGRKPPKDGGGDGDATPPPQQVPWGVNKVLTGSPSGGAGVDVAVVDTGIDLDHADLAANVQSDGANFVRAGKSADDDNGHGSHVAGTIACVDNTIGYVGVAPAANLFAVKVLDRRGSGTWSGVAAGVDWCRTNNIDIANMSLGGSSSNSTLKSACDAAENAGVLIIAAAGNAGDGSLATNEISYPAYYASVVSIGSTTSGDNLSSFSNTNADVEFSAPGSNVPSTYKNGGYKTLSGTSMASPHAAGIAALYWAASANPTPAGIVSDMQTTDVDLGDTGRDNGFGHGRVQK